MFGRMKRAWTEATRPKLYENFVEASHSAKFVRKFVGISVYTLNSEPGGRITAQFTYFGLICFLFWYLLYLYSIFRIYSLDLTVLRSLYETKLQRYGDEVERILTLLYFVYTMWKLPFEMSGNCYYAQILVDIDKAIEDLGLPIDYAKRARSTLVVVSVQIGIGATRILSIWATLSNLKIGVPYEKVFQVVYTDSLALITAAQYCLYLYALKCRYQLVNKVLDSIDSSRTRPFAITVQRKRSEHGSNMLQLQDKYMSERIKSCGKIYGMLYGASEAANRKFGLAIAVTMLMCLIFIILYLFYLMEATAAGLFYDFYRYMDFLVYVLWQIGFAVAIIFLNIYFCENTVKEAKVTSFLTHKIINSELNPMVRSEAVHLSLQVIHQLPSFTARGLCTINYVLLLEGSRTVTTFLVILLQFAADAH